MCAWRHCSVARDGRRRTLADSRFRYTLLAFNRWRQRKLGVSLHVQLVLVLVFHPHGCASNLHRCGDAQTLIIL